MYVQKNEYVSNKIKNKQYMDTQVSEGKRETTGVIGEWKTHTLESAPAISQGIDSRHRDGQHDSFFAVEKERGLSCNSNKELHVETGTVIPKVCSKESSMFTIDQKNTLEQIIQRNRRPIHKERMNIARSLSVDEGQVPSLPKRKRDIEQCTGVTSLVASDTFARKKHYYGRVGSIILKHFTKNEILELTKSYCQSYRDGNSVCDFVVNKTGLSTYQVKRFFVYKKKHGTGVDVASDNKKPITFDVSYKEEMEYIFKSQSIITSGEVTFLSRRHHVSEEKIVDFFIRGREDERIRVKKEMKVHSSAASSKGDSVISDVRSTNLTSNKVLKPLSRSKIRQSMSIPAALGAPVLLAALGAPLLSATKGVDQSRPSMLFAGESRPFGTDTTDSDIGYYLSNSNSNPEPDRKQ